MGAEWLPAIYRDRVRSQRTRSLELEIPERENAAEIQYTLLGIELKVGKRRFACPDLATARYLRVFARAGVRRVALPYDITQIAQIADEFELSWHRTFIYWSEASRDDTAVAAKRKRSSVVKSIREEIRAIGAGDAIPEFRQTMTQRKDV